MEHKRRNTLAVTLIGSIVILMILTMGTIWTGKRANEDTEEAVRSVSLLYLDELAGRREKVVAGNISDTINKMQTALNLMEPADLSDKSHLEAYQAKMKQFFRLERFAFIDTEGLGILSAFH